MQRESTPPPGTEVVEQLQMPRRIAYWSMATLHAAAVLQGHALLSASVGVAYLVASPMLWHALALRGARVLRASAWRSAGTSASHSASRNATTTVISLYEAACTSLVLVLSTSAPLAMAAIAALALVRIATEGARELGRFSAAVGAAAGVAACIACARGDAVSALDLQPLQLGLAFVWLCTLATAIAWLGNDARVAVLAAHQRARRSSRALARLAQRLGRYLAPGVRQMLADDEGIAAGSLDVDHLLDASTTRRAPRRRWLSICFADLVGFTRLTERLQPEDLAAVLDGYQRAMARLVDAAGGTLDKFTGDGVLVLFGDFGSRDRNADARACVCMALAMRNALPELNARIAALGVDAALTARFGIASGMCTVGDFGSEERLHYTALGPAVNLASRLERAAPAGEVVVAEATQRLLTGGDCSDRTSAPRLSLPGIESPVQAFRVVTDCAGELLMVPLSPPA